MTAGLHRRGGARGGPRLVRLAELHHLGLCLAPDVAPVVHEQLVVLQVTRGGGVGLLQIPHEFPQLGPGLSHPPGHVLRHTEAAALQGVGLPQHLVPVLVLLRGGSGSLSESLTVSVTSNVTRTGLQPATSGPVCIRHTCNHSDCAASTSSPSTSPWPRGCRA